MTVLSVKNRLVPGIVNMRDLTYVDFDSSERVVLTDSDVTRVVDAGSHWFLTNDLVLSLAAEEDEVGVSLFDLDVPDRRIKTYWRINTPAGAFREWDYWLGIRQDSLIYRTVSETRLIIGLNPDVVDAIRSAKTIGSLPLSSYLYGILVFPIDFIDPEGTKYTKTFAIKISTDAPFASFPTVEETLDPLADIENTFTTSVYSFENLCVPKLSCSFVYNFYDIEEENYDIIKERDYAGYKLRDIPRYMELTWEKSPRYIPPVVSVSGVEASGEAPPTIGFISEINESAELPESTTGGSGVNSADGDVAYAVIDGVGYEGDVGELGGIIMGSPGARTFLDAAGIYGDGVTTTLRDFGATETIRAGIDAFGTSVPSPRFELPYLKTGYVGYVIIKERYSEIDDDFIATDLIVIDDRNVTRWVDWKVAYREVYRYKIRSVFRYVNQFDLPMYKDSDESVIDISDKFDDFERFIALGNKETYYYDSKTSHPCEVEAAEFSKPHPPFNIKIFPDSEEGSIFISWNQKNSERDVAGFDVFRKKKEDRFFNRINSGLLDIRNNFFVDHSVDYEEEYIYAVQAIDYHDNFSDLSAQYAAHLEVQNIDIFERCEAPARFIEPEGMRIDGTRENRIFQTRKDNLLFFTEKFRVKINPIYKSSGVDEKFLFKILSLDTGTVKEIKFKLTTETIYHRAATIESPPPPTSLEERVATTEGGQAGLSNDYVGNIFGDRDFTR